MNSELIDIHIIATNDIHGMVFSSKNEANLMKAATYVNNIRRMTDHVLLVDNGNALTGSLSAYYFSVINKENRNPVVTVMNHMKYDAGGISLNDFQYGMRYFNKAQSLAAFPYLSANLLHQRTKEPYFNSPYIIKHMMGMKIGIVGLTARNDVSREEMKEIKVADVAQAAKRWIRHMRDKENPDYVIALYNGGITDAVITEDDDSDTMWDAMEGIDMMICDSIDDQVKRMEDRIFIQGAKTIDQLCHIVMKFKRRTTSFELVDVESQLVDIAGYGEERTIKEMLYYEEKMFHQFLQNTI